MCVHEASQSKHSILKLYKYVSLRALISFIEHGDIKITYKTDANDPYELSPKGEIPGVARDYECGFISLTKCNNNHSMWGNYADKFRGACIQFEIPYFAYDSSKSQDAFDNFLAEYNDKIRYIENMDNFRGLGIDCKFIRYHIINKKHVVNFEDSIMACIYKDTRYDPDEPISLYSKNGEHEYLLDLAKHNFLLATKEKSWEHEQEYRIPISERGITRATHGDFPMFFSNTITKYATLIELGPFCPFNKSRLRLNCCDSTKDIAIEKLTYNTDNYSFLHSQQAPNDSPMFKLERKESPNSSLFMGSQVKSQLSKTTNQPIIYKDENRTKHC